MFFLILNWFQTYLVSEKIIFFLFFFNAAFFWAKVLFIVKWFRLIISFQQTPQVFFQVRKVQFH